jgi:hypothetical protein
MTFQKYLKQNIKIILLPTIFRHFILFYYLKFYTIYKLIKYYLLNGVSTLV